MFKGEPSIVNRESYEVEVALWWCDGRETKENLRRCCYQKNEREKNTKKKKKKKSVVLCIEDYTESLTVFSGIRGGAWWERRGGWGEGWCGGGAVGRVVPGPPDLYIFFFCILEKKFIFSKNS